MLSNLPEGEQVPKVQKYDHLLGSFLYLQQLRPLLRVVQLQRPLAGVVGLLESVICSVRNVCWLYLYENTLFHLPVAADGRLNMKVVVHCKMVGVHCRMLLLVAKMENFGI